MSQTQPLFPAKQIAVLSGRELIGDGLIKIPFLRALRAVWPKARIHWVTTQGSTVYSTILKETVSPLLDEIHEQPEWLSKGSGKTPPPFDLVIDTRGRWKQALASRLTLPHDMFLSLAFHHLFSDRRPPLFAPRPERLVDSLLQLVELAAGYIPPVTGRLPVASTLMAKARRILPEDQIYIGFAPGAGNEVKRWPIENFEKVAQWQARMNRIPVFILGPQEMELYDRLFRSVPEAVFPLQAHDIWGTREIKVEHTLAVAACLDLAVSNDSGTGHMLAAIDCPLISLFGPTSAAKLAPLVSHGKTICAQDFGSEEMSAITPETVNEAINREISLLRRV